MTMKAEATDLDRALRQLHTPESFGRAILMAALISARSNNLGEMEARIAVSPPDPDGTIPVCFFLFTYEVCISLPLT
jgi:hypothetical protein